MSELTPEEIEQKKNEINAEIAKLEAEIEALNSYKGQLEEKYNSINDNVYTPEKDYDLSVTIDDMSHWKGKLEEEGVEYQETTATGIDSFMTGILEVMALIDEVVNMITESIGALRSELAALG